MSVREENVRLRIEAISELPTTIQQFDRLVELQQELSQAVKQSAQSIRQAIADEGAAVRAQTDEYKKQEAAQKASTAAARAAANESKASAREQADALKAVNAQYDQVGQSVRNFTSLLAAAFTIYEIKSFGQEIIDTKTKIDSFKVSLDTMLGSKKASADLYAQLVELAKKTPYTLEEVVEQTTKLKAYNIATEDLIPTITNLGNAAAAVGKEKLPQITLAYGQIMNMGRLMGAETKQLIEAGIDIYGLLAESMGKTKAEVQKMAADHTIMAADVKKAFEVANAAGGRFADMMVNMSKTVGGQVSNVGDAFFVAKGKIGDFFESQIRSGSRYMGELITAMAGSNSAIQRSVNLITTLVSAFTTYQLVSNATAIKEGALAAVMVVKNAAIVASGLVVGTYNLVMITAAGSTEGFTAAQVRAAAAARLSWTSMGPLVAILGVAYTAYMAYKTASEEVTSAIGEHQIALQKEQKDVQLAVEGVTKLGESDKKRKDAMQDLINKYPDYFAGLSAEHTNNGILKQMLDQVNGSYKTRIALAKEAYKTELIEDQFKKVVELEGKVMQIAEERLGKEFIVKIGGDPAKLLSALKQSTDQMDKFSGNGVQQFKQLFDGMGFGMEDALKRVVAGNVNYEKEKVASDGRVKGLQEKSNAELLALEETRHKAVIAQLKDANDGSAKDKAEFNNKMAVEEKRYQDHLLGIKGAEQKTELVQLQGHEDKKKTISLFTAKELAALTRGVYAETVEERLKSLNAQEEAEKEHINKVTVSRKISNEQIAGLREDGEKKLLAIQTKYQAIREVLEKEAEEIKFENYLKKARETEDKIAVLKVQQLEAQKILDKLNAVQTFDERLALFKEYGTKVGDELKVQAVEELRLQQNVSLKKLEDVRAEKGVLSQAYRDAHAQYLKDEQQYNVAVLGLTKETTQEKLKEIQEAEKQIKKAREETAESTKKSLEIEKKSRQEALTFLGDFLSKEFGLLGQISQAVISVGSNWDALSGKAVGLASGQKAWYDAMASNLLMLDDGTAKSAAAIAEAQANSAAANAKLEETKALSASAALGIFATVYQIANAIAAAFNGMMAESYKAIADGLARTREAYNSLYDSISESNKANLDQQLQDAGENFAERERLIKGYYATERTLIEDRGRIDIQLAYNQELAESSAKTSTKIKDHIQDIVNAQKNRVIAEQQLIIDLANFNRQEAQKLYDESIARIDSELKAFKDAKDAEIAKLNETLAIQKAANEQFYSDKQLRLQQDDVYRAQLLAQGEAREIAFLEAAKAREIQRATESGASAEELARIKVAFDLLISEKHAEYSDAIGNKTKAVSLANQEVKAVEKETVNNLEKDSANQISAIQQQIMVQEAQAAQEKKKANLDYQHQKLLAEQASFNAFKAQKVAELQAEIAVLNSKKNGFNAGRIDAATSQIQGSINDIQGLYFSTTQIILTDTSLTPAQFFQAYGITTGAGNSTATPTQPRDVNTGQPVTQAFDKDGNPMQLTYNATGKVIDYYDAAGNRQQVAYADGYVPKTGQRFFKGTPYLELGGNPGGVDTIPVLANEGERILPTADNLAIGGRSLTNDQLVDKVSFYDKFAMQFPQLLNPAGWAVDSVMTIPANIMADQGGGVNAMELREMIFEMQGLRTDILNKKYVELNMDKNGFGTFLVGQQSRTEYRTNLFKR
ncbi:tape measure protein [Spirosoma arcticum]